jgi:hypothetical protein
MLHSLRVKGRHNKPRKDWRAAFVKECGFLFSTVFWHFYIDCVCRRRVKGGIGERYVFCVCGSGFGCVILAIAKWTLLEVFTEICLVYRSLLRLEGHLFHP